MNVTPESFAQLLTHLLSGDNNVRQQAENIYHSLKKSPDQLTQLLLHMLKSSAQPEIRGLCCVLLRRLFLVGASSLWNSLSPPVQELVKSQLMENLKAETVPTNAHKIADCIANVAAAVMEKSQWPELLPFLFTCFKSPSESHRECSLITFSVLVQSASDSLLPHLAIIKEVFLAGLHDPSVKVQLASITAVSCFIQMLQKYQKEFTVLLEPMVNIILNCIKNNQETEAQEALSVIVALAEAQPLFLIPHFVDLANLMLKLALDKNIDSSIGHMALEFMLTFAEHKASAYRKNPVILQRLVELAFAYIVDLEEDPDWYTSEESDELGDSNHEVALDAFDRLAIHLEKTLPGVVFQMLPNFLASPRWQDRHGAILVISLIGEGCYDFMAPKLPEIMSRVLAGFSDPHPRVRWAACNSAGQMATDFAPKFQKQFHAQVLPALGATMEYTGFPRVQAHAACALINFCQGSKPRFVLPYADALVMRLGALLQTGPQTQAQAITAVAAIAECIDKDFVKYYDAVMPLMKQAMMSGTEKIRGRAMECATMIGVAVGVEKFRNDAKEIIHVLSHTPGYSVATLSPDDEMVSFVLLAWARLCTAMENEFVPFLPLVMPSLLTAASMKPDLIYQDDDDDDAPEGYEMIDLGDKVLGIKTSVMQEKSTACEMLVSFARQLEGHFFDYVEQVAITMIPLIQFYYDESVRTAAIQCLPPLVKCATKGLEMRGKPRSEAVPMFDKILNELCTGAENESDIPILTEVVTAIQESIELMGDHCLNPTQLERVIKTVELLLTEFEERRVKREREAEEEEDDEEAELHLEEENSNEENLLYQISLVFTQVFQTMKTDSLQGFQKVLPLILRLMGLERRPHDRQIALCVFCDLVEHLQLAALPFFPHFIQPMINGIGEDHPGIRQACVYGIGWVAQVAGQHGASLIPDITQRIIHMISAKESRSEDNIFATENAISALGKICLYCPTLINVAQVLPLWLDSLPVTEDTIESKVTYKLLCDFIESPNFHPHLFGEGGKSVPKITTVLLQTLDSDLIDEDTSKRVVNILKQLQAQIGIPALNAFLQEQEKLKWQKFVV